jgi:hypothetical protein
VELLIDGVPNNFVAPPDNISSSDSTVGVPPPYSNNTTVFASRQSAGTSSVVRFNFLNNSTTGTCPLGSIVLALNNTTSATVITPTPQVNVTAFGAPLTGFIEGNFTIQMNIAGTNRTVACTFRVRRS